ncbi:MAG TPA: STAS domain-containing protein [Anaeromyxobacteraceae bacterium]|nr:STAS domain-containing protein [Anaeromyxobacteraceae bacterium]
MQVATEGQAVEIRMEGVFDVSAAQVVVRAIEKTPADRFLQIDLTHVREFHDFAVAVLAQALAQRPEHVAVLGLRQHQRRLLAYLGLGQAAGPAEVPDSAIA